MSYAELTPPSEVTPIVVTSADRAGDQPPDEWATDFQDAINLNVGGDFPPASFVLGGLGRTRASRQISIR